MTCYYIVRTPLQLLGALEYRHARADIANHVIATDFATEHQFNAGGKLFPAVDGLERIDAWQSSRLRLMASRIARIRGGWTIDEWSQRRFAERLLPRIRPHDVLVVGNPMDCMCEWLLRHTKCSERVAVDDGLANVDFALHSGEHTDGSTRQRLRRLIWGSTTLDPRSLHYFTMFETLRDKGLRTTHHAWPYLSRLRQGKLRSVQAEAWYLGQPLVGSGYISRTDQVDLVERCVDSCQKAGLTLRYACHPSETPEHMPPHWRAFKLELPIEWHLSQSQEVPCAVLSAFSSALISLAELLRGTSHCAAVELDAHSVLPSRLATYRRVWGYLQRESNCRSTLTTIGASELRFWLGSNT
jgi:hypothetical protein